MRKARHCKASGCKESLYLGGFCKRHHAEDVAKAKRRSDALELLHTSVLDNGSLHMPALRDELYRLQRWWGRVCSALQLQRADPVLQDEADYALEWCIALAQEIADADRSLRHGGAAWTPNLEPTRQWVWERFANLERGLMSNGVKRN